MKSLLVVLSVCCLYACKSEEAALWDDSLRAEVNSFFTTKDESQIRSQIFSPAGFTEAALARMVKEQMVSRVESEMIRFPAC